ncbi:MAG: glycosyltransferase family 1 protein, partial [Prevotellaceae bacterium]|nr:glycosyltransferase family 1 protein [Prevotellaceae bacterium]
MKNRDFIITSLQSWDIEIGSTIKNTALELSKQNRVLYINPPMDYATRLRAMLHTSGKLSPAFVRRMEVIKGNADPIRIINRNLWVVDCPFTLHSVSKLPGSLFNLFNRENNKQIGRLIVREAAALGFEQYIHLIDTDIFRSRYLKEFIRPAVS